MTDHERLVGGMSSVVVLCTFTDQEPLVLRVIDDAEWLERDPGIIAQEAEALRLLRHSAVVAPNWVADQVEEGIGRLLMTRVTGRMQVATDEINNRIDAMADLAAAIAASPLPADHRLPPWRTWVPTDRQPPPWGNQAMWNEAISFHRSRPAPAIAEPVLLHRDFHPLNILWFGGGGGPSADSATGQAAVVDWVNACVGHPHAELAHCRWNLSVTVDPTAADRFLQRYLDVTATDGCTTPDHFDPWWDVDSVLDKFTASIDNSGWHAVGRTDLTDDRIIAASETMLRSALNRL